MCLEGGRTDDDGVIVVVRGCVIELDARMVFIYAPEQAGQPRQTATDDGRASRRKGQTVLVYWPSIDRLVEGNRAGDSEGRKLLSSKIDGSLY